MRWSTDAPPLDQPSSFASFAPLREVFPALALTAYPYFRTTRRWKSETAPRLSARRLLLLCALRCFIRMGLPGVCSPPLHTSLAVFLIFRLSLRCRSNAYRESNRATRRVQASRVTFARATSARPTESHPVTLARRPSARLLASCDLSEAQPYKPLFGLNHLFTPFRAISFDLPFALDSSASSLHRLKSLAVWTAAAPFRRILLAFARPHGVLPQSGMPIQTKRAEPPRHRSCPFAVRKVLPCFLFSGLCRRRCPRFSLSAGLGLAPPLQGGDAALPQRPFSNNLVKTYHRTAHMSITFYPAGTPSSWRQGKEDRPGGG
jgi:hypothetical protein